MKNLNKRSIILLLSLLFANIGLGQKTLTWQSTSNTSFTIASNWYDEGAKATSTTSPASGDIVVINNSRLASVSPTLSGANPKSIGNLTVGNGYTLTLTSSNTITLLTVGNNSVGNNDITIQAGGIIDNQFMGTSGNGLVLY